MRLHAFFPSATVSFELQSRRSRAPPTTKQMPATPAQPGAAPRHQCLGEIGLT